MKLSQEQLSRQSGVHRTTIARIEVGSYSPRMDTLERLSAVLGDLSSSKNFAEDVVNA
jgi:predicted transcriptional regulator